MNAQNIQLPVTYRVSKNWKWTAHHSLAVTFYEHTTLWLLKTTRNSTGSVYDVWLYTLGATLCFRYKQGSGRIGCGNGEGHRTHLLTYWTTLYLSWPPIRHYNGARYPVFTLSGEGATQVYKRTLWTGRNKYLRRILRSLTNIHGKPISTSCVATDQLDHRCIHNEKKGTFVLQLLSLAKNGLLSPLNQPSSVCATFPRA